MTDVSFARVSILIDMKQTWKLTRTNEAPAQIKITLGSSDTCHFFHRIEEKSKRAIYQNKTRRLNRAATE